MEDYEPYLEYLRASRYIIDFSAINSYVVDIAARTVRPTRQSHPKGWLCMGFVWIAGGPRRIQRRPHDCMEGWR